MCQEGLPKTDIFPLCAYYVLEYKKLLEENEIRQKPLNEIVNNEDKKQKKTIINEEYDFEDVTVEKLSLKKIVYIT